MGRTACHPGFRSGGQIPIKSIKKLSKELEKRDMLVPAEIILDAVVEDRADIPINAIHIYSGLKADLYPVREGDELRQSAFRRRDLIDYGHPIGKVYIHSPEDLILYKLIYFGGISNRSIPETLQRSSNQKRMNLIWTILRDGQLI